ncbi:MAG: hypothetical protein KGI38_00540 [Thaumarchaeota archaeon]|nr:hypothetical protein [Nitrososphaerota archaeon]
MSLQLGSLVYFDIEGMADLRGHSRPVVIRRCILIRTHASHGAAIELEGDFICQEAVFNEESTRARQPRRLLIGFELANVARTFRVIVNTELGELTLRHSDRIAELERRMNAYGSPLVTSSATFEVPPNGRPLGEVLKQATDIVEKFLKITSLAQSRWHTWVAVSVYEASEGGEGGELRYLAMRHTKLLASSGRSLTILAHSSRFIQAAWNGYSRETAQEYGFDLALEWFIAANAPQLLESKFLSATTCLELLMDRYSREAGNESLLSRDDFRLLKTELQAKLRGWARRIGLNDKTLVSLEAKLGELNRRSYAEKAEQMLAFWNLRHDDLGVTIGQIVAIRNKITHTGDAIVSGSHDQLLRTYNAIMTIIARVLLAMLDYQDQYYDWVKGAFVNFADVRIT